MKIRNGFVSNSSSSSFVIWGVKVSVKQLMKMFPFKVNPEYPDETEEDIQDDIQGYLSDKLPKGLTTESLRDYFSDDKTKDIVIGVSNVSLDDGVATVIPEINKSDLVKKLETIGIKKEEKDIKLYVQMISNDNY